IPTPGAGTWCRVSGTTEADISTAIIPVCSTAQGHRQDPPPTARNTAPEAGGGRGSHDSADAGRPCGARDRRGPRDRPGLRDRARPDRRRGGDHRPARPGGRGGRAGGGAIVSLSSLAARVGGIVTAPDYATSKAGVIGLTRTLARQYGPKGIRVNAVAPGPIMTEMTRHWSEDVRREFIARIPLRRLGTAEDVASVVVFLAGPESGYVTGATIDINGG